MKHFTIDAENNFTFHSSRREAKGTGGALFSTEEQFADAIGNDNQRLLQIWNSLPGVKPVTRFANRKGATERIWKVIQKLGPVATKPASQPDDGALKSDHAPTEAPPENGVMPAAPASQSPAPQASSEPAADQPNVAREAKTQQVGATSAAEPEVIASVGVPVANVAPSAAKTTKKATGRKKTSTADPQAKATREPSKTDTILKLLTGPGGASLKTLMDTTGWQAHSVRGFVSGTLGKKMGLTVVSAKGDNGDRRYLNRLLAFNLPHYPSRRIDPGGFFCEVAHAAFFMPSAARRSAATASNVRPSPSRVAFLWLSPCQR